MLLFAPPDDTARYLDYFLIPAHVGSRIGVLLSTRRDAYRRIGQGGAHRLGLAAWQSDRPANPA